MGLAGHVSPTWHLRGLRRRDTARHGQSVVVACVGARWRAGGRGRSDTARHVAWQRLAQVRHGSARAHALSSQLPLGRGLAPHSARCGARSACTRARGRPRPRHGRGGGALVSRACSNRRRGDATTTRLLAQKQEARGKKREARLTEARAKKNGVGGGARVTSVAASPSAAPAPPTGSLLSFPFLFYFLSPFFTSFSSFLSSSFCPLGWTAVDGRSPGGWLGEPPGALYSGEARVRAR